MLAASERAAVILWGRARGELRAGIPECHCAEAELHRVRGGNLLHVDPGLCNLRSVRGM